MRPLTTLLRRFARDDTGVALIEFALAASFLLIPAFVGIVEVSRYIQMSEKLDDATANLLNAINQNYTVNDAQIAYFADSVPTMVAPFAADGWTAIITAVNKGPQPTCKLYALWQSTKSDKNTAQKSTSQIAAGSGSRATIPGMSDLDPNDQVLIVELYLQYHPIIDSDYVRKMIGLNERGMYRVAVARPRYGAFLNDPVSGAQLTPKC